MAFLHAASALCTSGPPSPYPDAAFAAFAADRMAASAVAPPLPPSRSSAAARSASPASPAIAADSMRSRLPVSRISARIDDNASRSRSDRSPPPPARRPLGRACLQVVGISRERHRPSAHARLVVGRRPRMHARACRPPAHLRGKRRIPLPPARLACPLQPRPRLPVTLGRSGERLGRRRQNPCRSLVVANTRPRAPASSLPCSSTARQHGHRHGGNPHKAGSGHACRHGQAPAGRPGLVLSPSSIFRQCPRGTWRAAEPLHGATLPS